MYRPLICLTLTSLLTTSAVHAELPFDRVFIRTGDPVAELPGATIATLGAPVLSSEERMLIDATLAGPGITSEDDQALLLVEEDGASRIIFREGDLAPGGPVGALGEVTLDAPLPHKWVTTAGDVVAVWSVTDAANTPGLTAILESRRGIQQQRIERRVAATTEPAPGLDGGAMFRAFLDVFVSQGTGEIAFTARTGTGSLPDGVWRDSGAGLELAIRRDTEVATIRDQTFGHGALASEVSVRGNEIRNELWINGDIVDVANPGVVDHGFDFLALSATRLAYQRRIGGTGNDELVLLDRFDESMVTIATEGDLIPGSTDTTFASSGGSIGSFAARVTDFIGTFAVPVAGAGAEQSGVFVFTTPVDPDGVRSFAVALGGMQVAGLAEGRTYVDPGRNGVLDLAVGADTLVFRSRVSGVGIGEPEVLMLGRRDLGYGLPDILVEEGGTIDLGDGDLRQVTDFAVQLGCAALSGRPCGLSHRAVAFVVHYASNGAKGVGGSGVLVREIPAPLADRLFGSGFEAAQP